MARTKFRPRTRPKSIAKVKPNSKAESDADSVSSDSKCFNCGTPNPSLQPKQGSSPELTEAECSAVLFDFVLQNGLAAAVPDHLFLQMRQESVSEFVEYCRTCKSNLKFIKNRLDEIERIKAKVEQQKQNVQTKFVQSRPFLDSELQWNAFAAEEEGQVQVQLGGRGGAGGVYDGDDEGQNLRHIIKTENLEDDESVDSSSSSPSPLLQPISLSPVKFEHIDIDIGNIQIKSEKIENVGPLAPQVSNSSSSLALSQFQQVQGLPSFGRLLVSNPRTADSSQGTTTGLVAMEMEMVGGGACEPVCTDYKGLMEQSLQNDNCSTGTKSLVSAPERQNLKMKKELPWSRFKKKRLQCRYCKKKLSHIHFLKCHMRQAHADQVSAKRFDCKFCTERFALRKEALKHKKIHKDEMRYECAVCEKKLRTEKHVTRHFKSSHKE